MKVGSSGVLGLFDSPAAAKKGVDRLKEIGLDGLTVYSPCASHEVEEAIGAKASRVRWFTLVGALTGCAFGFALATYTSLVWSQIVGGKPIVSIPPFVIIAFEMTVLFGGLATFLGVLVTARLPRRRLAKEVYERFSANKVGLFVACSPPDFSKAQEALQAAGAEEVVVETS